MMKKRAIAVTSCFLAFYTVAVFLYYYYFSTPYLTGLSTCQAAADAMTYIELANDIDFNDYLAFGTNLFGPVLLVRLLDSNFLIVMFNFTVLILSCDILRRMMPQMNPLGFAIFLLNPMVFISIGAVNKEIPAIFAALLTVFSLPRKYYFLFFVSLLISLFMRWQQFLVAVLYFLFIFIERLVPFARSRMLVLLMLAISFAFPLVLNEVVSDAANIDAIIEGESLNRSTVAMTTFNTWQANYLYILAFPFKVILNFFGGIGKIYFFDFDVCNIYQTFAVFGSSIVFLFVFLLLLRNPAKLKISDDSILFMILYTFIFTISPFVSHRYYLPIFPFLCSFITFSASGRWARF